MMSSPYWINPEDKDTPFPPVEYALRDPNGLLAIGADLSINRLVEAYTHGIFPWYNEGQPLLWWSPDPRCVLFPERIHISKSLKKTIRNTQSEVTFDQSFEEVIRACARPRPDQDGTWIHEEMIQAYCKLFDIGMAHSVETRLNGELVGGLYGVAIGRIFFGESMFSMMTDMSKIAFVYLSKQLQQWGFPVIDCQIYSSHLESLGAEMIPRQDFISILESVINNSPVPSPWQFSLQKDELF
jgi:leucyl/phenylalanyl-tRNA--protein transferase